jgi:ATP-dependent Lon protease
MGRDFNDNNGESGREFEQRRNDLVKKLVADLKLENTPYGLLAPEKVEELIYDPQDGDDAYCAEDSGYLPAKTAREKEKAEAEDRFTKQRDATASALARVPKKRMVEIFPPSEVEKCLKRCDTMASDNKVRVKATLKTLAVADGMREIPSFKSAGKTLEKMKALFGNFAGVIDEIADDLTFAGITDPKSMNFAPLLLNGHPGVGKTAFAQSMAKILGLPFLKLAAGGISHASVLCGTSSHWSTSQPGEIFNLLALNGTGAGAAILLLDEVDKLTNREEYGVLPALLDLLEKETSREYRDESLGLTFDASKLIILMTSNYPERIDKALMSRCRFRNIKMPGIEQKRAVAISMHAKINGDLPKSKRTSLCAESLELMVQGDMSIRTLVMQVQKACSTALRSGNRVATLQPLELKREEAEKAGPKARSIGFVPVDTCFYLQ